MLNGGFCPKNCNDLVLGKQKKSYCSNWDIGEKLKSVESVSDNTWTIPVCVLQPSEPPWFSPPQAAHKCFTWQPDYFPSQCYTFPSHYHAKLFYIKCNPEIEYAWALHGRPNTWQKILLLKGRYECPMAACTNAQPSAPRCWIVCRGKCSFRVSIPGRPVGGTVTVWQPRACWIPPAAASAALYLPPLRSFHGWEKITVFADDNAIN